jgi:broad specificity phosphatase PhoE
MNEDDDDVLPVGVDSLSDYTPYKLHLLSTTTVSADISTPEELSPINIDNASSLSSNKSKTSSKKKSFIRCFLPINRSRSSSVQYEQDQQQSDDNCDMRFFIIRHGERIDRYFGSNWYKLAFDQNGQYRPYHRNFPPSLPFRSNTYLWALDTPLTLLGLSSAEKLGRTLRSKHSQPNYVYSSPAMRCILTTIQILKGLKLEKQIPIRIEPGLLELGAARFGMNIFFQPIDWHKYGINIDLSYQPITTNIAACEREDAYYLRSKYVIREIEKRHKKSSDDLLNIFIIAHATSPETLTWDLIGKQPNIEDLYELSLKIAYLQMVITEHQRENKLWSLKPMK